MIPGDHVNYCFHKDFCPFAFRACPRAGNLTGMGMRWLRLVTPMFFVACSGAPDADDSQGGGGPAATGKPKPLSPGLMMPPSAPAESPALMPAPKPDPTMMPAVVPKPVPTCATPDVGAAPLRRLTRDEYANAVRDLFGLTTRPGVDGLTADETIGSFRSNTVGAASDLITQQYQELSEKIVKANLSKLEPAYPCDRATMGDDVCGGQFIDRFGQRAYRRALAVDEKAKYKTLFSGYAKTGGYGEGLRLVVQTMLQSPHFLYHVELGDGAAGVLGPLGGYAVASRLSFFLWMSIPDQMLLDAAAGGQLNTPAGLKIQVDRLLKDPKARDAIQSFHLQWMDIEAIASVGKDKIVYPNFATALRDAMRNETVNFVDHVIRRGDGKLDTLLTSSSSMVDGGLFDLYGVQKPATFVPGQLVPLDATQRAGLLTQAAVLTVHAHANQSSPVARGVMVRKTFLCQSLPDPPPNVNTEAPEPAPNSTTRERFEVHKKNVACAACHKLIDGIGFGFERYDGVGAYRAMENGKSVDASGEIIGSRDINGTFNGAVELAQKLARSAETQECVAKQWFQFALGRAVTDADKCAFEQAMVLFQNAGRDLRVLIGALAVSDAFRFRRN